MEAEFGSVKYLPALRSSVTDTVCPAIHTERALTDARNKG